MNFAVSIIALEWSPAHWSYVCLASIENPFLTLARTDSSTIPDFAKAGIDKKFFIDIAHNKWPSKTDLDGKENDDILRYINEELPKEMYPFRRSLLSS